MSIQKIVLNAIESFRQKVNVLATLDSQTASLTEKAEAIETVLANDPMFWSAIARMTVAKPKKTPATAAPIPVPTIAADVVVTKPVAKPAIPVQVSKPFPGKPKDTPARVLRPKPAPISGMSDFGAKLNGVAAQLGLKDNSPLAVFRRVMVEDGRGRDFWDRCREVTFSVLVGGLIKEKEDWKLLIAKMKDSLFFNSGETASAFIAQCPKEGIADLLLADDGLWNMVESIRNDSEFSAADTYHLDFVIDLCVVVGREAKTLLTNTKHAVNRMKQLGFITEDHWLVRRVAAMKVVRPTAPDNLEVVPTPTLTEAKLDTVQEVAEAAVEEVAVAS